jgi:ATP synthase protein I
MFVRLQSKAIRTVLRWQVVATVVIAVASGWLAGVHGAISAVLGGVIGIAPGLVFAVLASRTKPKSAGEALLVMLRAEAVKLGLMVILLVLVLAVYAEAVVPALIAAFIVSVIVFSMAVLVKEV